MKILLGLLTAISAMISLNNRATRTILAIALILSFAACGQDTPKPSGDIDQRLIGSWQASTAEIYVFHTDGRFNHFSTTSQTEGKFTASGNKVYFANIIYEKGETWEEQYPDAIYEYEIGKDDDGDYLKIANFLYGVTYVDISTAYKFRK
ncbi:MAG: hypothetical protein KIT62_07310 [Cyclobacteriaceae bacterium]|nr:hypothetical protein [Cyclobacteriaceae bacterium]